MDVNVIKSSNELNSDRITAMCALMQSSNEAVASINVARVLLNPSFSLEDAAFSGNDSSSISPNMAGEVNKTQYPKPFESVWNVRGTKDQTKVKSNFRSQVADKVFNRVNISIPCKFVEKDASSSKSTISNVKEKVDTLCKPSLASVVHEKPQTTIVKIKELRNEVSVNGDAVTIPMEAVESVNALNTILKKDEIKRVPVWVKMHHVPIVAYSDGRSAYARALIEIVADVEVKSLVIAIPVGNKEGHTLATIDIEYEWTPPRCASCCIFDHVSEKCPKLPTVASIEKVADDGFIEVKKKKAKANKNSKKQVEGIRQNKPPLNLQYRRVDRGESSNHKNNEVASKVSTNKGPRQVPAENTQFTTNNSFSALSGEVDTNLEDDDRVISGNKFHVESHFVNDIDEDVDEYITMVEISNAVHKVVIYDNKLSVCAILESHVANHNLERLCKHVFKHWNWISNAMSCLKGTRIIVGWNQNDVDVVVIHQDPQVIHTRIWIKADWKEFFCSFVYAFNNYIHRRPLWNGLCLHKNYINNRPWCLLGDFNASLFVEDTSMGSSALDITMREFKECVETMEVMDVQRTGLQYIWNQKPKGKDGILRKLDRVLANLEFLDVFMGAHAVFKPYRISDHSPSVLSIPSLVKEKPKPFKFFNVVILDDRFKDVVRNGWMAQIYGFYMFCVVKKLKGLKKPIRKAKITWLKEGDSNTAYFHKVIKSRVSWSRIDVVTDANGNVHHNNDVAKAFINHYAIFLGQSGNTSNFTTDNLFPTRLNDSEALNMVRDISSQEVKSAMFSMGNDKSSGPDGFTAAFFKDTWDIIGADVTKAVSEFFTNGRLLKELNHTIIALIPKVNTPARVTDYRPISCCNVLFKCISKIIANRLKDSLKRLVSPNQSAFVSGRCISDNILLTQEIMHNYHLDRGVLRCAFKVDIQKAYDTVDWDFLRVILIGFGFHERMIAWIMECVTTTSFSISINGSLHGYFEGKRGLRQAKVIKDALDDFKDASGLNPSMPKSKAYFCNVINYTKLAILNVLPFEEERLLVKYLGVPLVSSRLIFRDCKELIEKVHNRVNDWKNKCLSIAGRLQLIQSVLGSLHVYWASVFMLPTRMLLDIEKIMRIFLWCQGNMSRGKAKVAWDVVCLPKQEGGLGISRLHHFNKALMVSHVWKLLSLKESLWVKWIYVYKLKNKSFWDIPYRGTMSWSWRKLLLLRPLIREFIWSCIGDGKSTSIWFDKWCVVSPLSNIISSRDIARAVFTHASKVRDCIQDGLWKWPNDWFVKYPILNSILVPIIIDDNLDSLEWRSRDGMDKPFSMHNVWSRVQQIAGLTGVGPSLASIVTHLMPIAKRKSSKSCIGAVQAKCLRLMWHTVKLHDVPIQVFEEDGISLIATYLGKPIMLDSYTSSMCKESWGRSSFAWCLTEINSEVEFMESITIGLPDLDGPGYTETIRVKYEWKPPRCPTCNIFGHTSDTSPKRVVTTPVINVANDTNDGFQKVMNKKRNNKGIPLGHKLPKGVSVSKGFQVRKEFAFQPRSSNVGSNGNNGTRGETNPKVSPSTYSTKGGSFNTKDTNDRQHDTNKKKISNITSPNPFAALGVDNDEDEDGLNQSPKQKEVRQVVNENNLSVCVILYYYIDRRELWKNLVGHARLMRNRPWVLLDDFNVTLNLEDHSVGGYEPTAIMREFKECVQAMEVADVNSTGLHFTWNQKPKGSNVILKKIDRIIGNIQFNDYFLGSLAIFQPYRILDHSSCVLRILTIRIELDEAQKAIDRDPSSYILHEDHAYYLLAFIEAQLDEERFLKQKAKIEWIKAGDSNTSYFHKIVKSTPEIGLKWAPGPNGFDAALFKKAWDVVGGDITCDVQDFFSNGKLLKELNYTIISLIPKVSTPTRIKDYRPISCCNVLYKCVSKIIVNRVKEGLGDIVSINQSAFVPGRKQGLQQGGPLSPYLFTLVMEILTLILQLRMCDSDDFQYHHLCEQQRIINLCFADDLFLFFGDNPSSVAVIIDALEEFKQVWSKLRVLCGLDYIPPRLIDVTNFIYPISKAKTAVSILSRLVLVATSYYIWLKRNGRLFKKKNSVMHVALRVLVEMSQVCLLDTDTKSEPFEDTVKNETPESPHIVASPTSLPDSTPPTHHAEESKDSDTTARMVVHVLPVMSPSLSASIADVAAMFDSAFHKRFRSFYESSPLSSPLDLPSHKRSRGTSELVEDDEEDEEDEEVEESLDSNSESEDVKDEGPTTEDEGLATWDEGLTAGDEGLGIRVESLSLGGDEAVPEGQQWATSIMETAMGQGSGSVLEPERPERVSALRHPTVTTWIDPDDGRAYIDFPVYPPPASHVQTPPSPKWSSGSLPVSSAPSIVHSPISSPMIPLTVPSITTHNFNQCNIYL
nr:hypothetical protein [Tanacetum cinerariifolium]